MTFPPICDPLGGGGGGGVTAGPAPMPTFPPVCGGDPGIGPQVGAGRGRVPWTATGTVVEPRCFFPTQSGDTCPRNWCNIIPTFDRIFCAPRTLVAPTCIACANQPNMVGFGGGGDPWGGGWGGGGWGEPTPTATFPPVCGGTNPVTAGMPPTIYPQHTCGFVCNTMYPPCGWEQQQAPQPQVGAIFGGGTLVSPRCLRTIDIVVCQPTTRGDTCPPTLCTIFGVGCPTRRLVGAAAWGGGGGGWGGGGGGWGGGGGGWGGGGGGWGGGGGGWGPTVRPAHCFPTIGGQTCDTFRCIPPTQWGNTCPVDACPQPTLMTETCDTFRCPQPTLFGTTCPIDQCIQPTLATESCDTFRCAQPTFACAQGGGFAPQNVGAPTPWLPIRTIVGATCPVCPVTLSGSTCPLQTCNQPLPTIFGYTCAVLQCFPTLTGFTCPRFLCW